jgi:hypothetical protein
MPASWVRPNSPSAADSNATRALLNDTPANENRAANRRKALDHSQVGQPACRGRRHLGFQLPSRDGKDVPFVCLVPILRP